MESVPLRIGAGLEVGRAGSSLDIHRFFLVRRVLQHIKSKKSAAPTILNAMVKALTVCSCLLELFLLPVNAFSHDGGNSEIFELRVIM